jgi:hypothetical protein
MASWLLHAFDFACVRASAVIRASARGLVWIASTLFAISLLARSGAHAQVAQPAATEPVQQQSARHTHAHADRVILVPTAETHPEGTLFLSSYEIVVPSIGYAVTDRLHASITGLTDFDAVFVELNLKANVLRSRFLRIALTSSIDYSRGGDADEDNDELLFGRAGGSVQFCFELACRTSLSLAVMVVAHDELDTLLPMGLGAGFTAQLGEDLFALLEYSALINAAREFEFVDLPIYLVGYGLRIAPKPSWALDLTMLRAMESDDEVRAGDASLFDLLGVPFVAFTYRFLP